MEIKNFYKILSISEKASTKEIISAFRRLAKEYHPDLNKSPDAVRMFRDIYEAYELLSNESKRAQYDIFLMYERQNQNFSRARENVNYGSTSNAKGQSYKKYSEWTESARRNADKYSTLSYKDFAKVVLKSITKFSVELFKVLIEILIYQVRESFKTNFAFIGIIIVFFIIMIPILSFETNITLGLVSLSFSVAFISIYFLVGRNQKSLIDFFLKKNKNWKLYLRILLFYALYCILVVVFYFSHLNHEKKAINRIHALNVQELVVSKGKFPQEYPSLHLVTHSLSSPVTQVREKAGNTKCFHIYNHSAFLLIIAIRG